MAKDGVVVKAKEGAVKTEDEVVVMDGERATIAREQVVITKE